MQDKEKMFLDLNSVLVKFWIENKRPDKAVKIELLERMLNWYKKMGYVTLDKQEEKKLPEGLEEAADEYEKEHTYQRYDGGGLTPEYDATLAETFIAGAEWGMNQMPLPEDTTIFQKGIAEGKRLMMEGAVEADVNTYEDLATRESLAEFVVEMPTKNLGDKVKVIVIPEEK